MKIRDFKYNKWESREGRLGPEIYVWDEKLGGYTAFFLDFSNIVTQGETIDEAQKNLWNTVYDILKNFLNK
jgi:hypothetical protein